jgi:creatinine amidohydrolase
MPLGSASIRVADLNWLALERYLETDDRIVLPLGSTEQHAYLSLATDNILAEGVAVEAAEPLGVPVLPVLPYGVAPAFAAYPGSPALRLATYAAVVRDLLDSLYGQGFRRVLIVNGHGGNTPARAVAAEWMAASAGAQALHHDWWIGPKVLVVVRSIDPVYGHASWLENFPWTRLPGVEPPEGAKPLFDEAAYRVSDPPRVRELLGDGSFGGRYARDDGEMQRIWDAGVVEVRDLLAGGWRVASSG